MTKPATRNYFPYPHFKHSRPACAGCNGTHLRPNLGCPMTNCEFSGSDANEIRNSLRVSAIAALMGVPAAVEAA